MEQAKQQRAPVSAKPAAKLHPKKPEDERLAQPTVVQAKLASSGYGAPAPPPTSPPTSPGGRSTLDTTLKTAEQAREKSAASRKPSLVRPPARRQLKAACATCGTSSDEEVCPTCQAKAAPRLERPPSATQPRRADPSQDPAERQADEIGARIGTDLASVGSFGHGPVPEATRSVAEQHLGVSLFGAELRNDTAAHASAASYNALAVTEGASVSFASGQLNGATAAGRALVGHELVHVAQQSMHGVVISQRDGEGGAPGFEATPTGAEGAGGQSEPIPLSGLDEPGKLLAIQVMLQGGGTPASLGTGAGGTGPAEVTGGEAYAFTIAEAWESFGGDINRIARENPFLWEQSRGYLSGIAQVAQLVGAFPAVVEDIATKNLDTNKRWATEELGSIGGARGQSIDPSTRTASQKKRLEVLQETATAVQLAQSALQALRTLSIYDTEAIEQGILGSSHPGLGFVEFDPSSPHSDYGGVQPKNEEEKPEAPTLPDLGRPYLALLGEGGTSEPETRADVGPAFDVPPTIETGRLSPEKTHNWSAVKAEWDRLQAAILTVTEDAPGVYSLLAHERIDEFTSADGDTAFAILNETLNSALDNIDVLRANLGTGISWSDLPAIHQQVLAGAPTQDGLDWTSPVAALAAQTALSDRASREFWIALGITAGFALLVLTGSILLAGAPLAVAMSAAAVGADVVGAGLAVADAVRAKRTAELQDTAKKASVAPQVALDREGGSATRISGLASLALGILGVVSVPRGQMALLLLETRAGKGLARAALRFSLLRAAGKGILSEAEQAVFKAGIKWQAHHLIPLELVERDPLLRAAIRAEYNINRASASMLLPSVELTETQWRRILPKGTPLPTHQVHPQFTKFVENQLTAEYDDLVEAAHAAGMSFSEATRRNPRALIDAVSRVESAARAKVLSVGGIPGSILR